MRKIHIYFEICILFTGCLVDGFIFRSVNNTTPGLANTAKFWKDLSTSIIDAQKSLPVRIPFTKTLEAAPGITRHQTRVPFTETSEPAPGITRHQTRVPFTETSEPTPGITRHQTRVPFTETSEPTPGITRHQTRVPFTETSEPTLTSVKRPNITSHQNIEDAAPEIHLESIEQSLGDIEDVQKEILEKVENIYGILSFAPRQDTSFQLKNLLAIPISPIEIEVTWGSPEKTITLYKLYYNETLTTQRIVTLLPAVTKYNLVDLIPGTTYIIQLTAQTNEQVVFTAFVKTRTQAFVAEEPSRVEVQAVSSRKMSVKWQPPCSKGCDGILRGYSVYHEEIDESNEPIYSTEKVETVDDGKTNELVIVDLLPGKRYRVSVAAFTRKGEGDRSQYSIISTAVPSEPILTVELEQESQTAWVRWSKPDVTSGELKGYRLQWGRKPSSKLDTVLFNETVLAWKTPILDQDGIYEFRVDARNEIDHGQTAVALFHVLYKVSGSAPRNLKAQREDGNFIRLEWEEPKIYTGTIEGYRIIDTSLTESHWGYCNISRERTTITFGNWLPNTTYAFAINAYFSGGMGPLSATVKVPAVEIGQVRPPRNVKAYATSPNQIDVSWDPPQNMDNSTKYRYKIYFNDTGDMNQGKIIIIEGTFQSFTDLVPDTVYIVQVAVFFAGTESPRSRPVQVKTNEFIPGEPRNVNVYQVNETTFCMMWQPPQIEKGIIRGYNVYYSQIDDSDGRVMRETEKLADTLDGTKRNLWITGLLPDTEYQVSVAAYTGRGDGNRSRPETAKTGAPGLKSFYDYIRIQKCLYN